ncbi:hypothetical protein OSB04_003688 [Centaurea solstitialis]|uniref:Uncharacterized protein n=1 Tax=Centaurea solstitialis TaxID=347529 RepID=A0AA38WNF6_9ASTR|nr:hypothetical protein OSB04_003688 [Centaurea solstitialis]
MEKQTNDLYYVIQKPRETIRDYFNRFNAAMIEVKNCDVKTAIEAYKRGLEDSSGLYLELTKYPPENFDDVRARTLAFMRIEDDGLFRRKHSAEKKPLGAQKHDFKHKRVNKIGNPRQESKARPSKGTVKIHYPELSSYNFSSTSKDLVNSLRKIDANVRWPKKSDKPSKDKDQNRWCDFHEDHDHTTDECISLKKEISYLKSKGHLKGVIPEEQGRQHLQFILKSEKSSYLSLPKASTSKQSSTLKSRKFAPECNKVINDEVDNLLKTGKIREVKYPKWLANVVVVQKKNGKWRVYIDFTDLNKACPKDHFPLPHIDAMVDATAGHEMLTFMDAYSGYNQILMHTDDQEKTAFMTDKGIYCYKVMPFGLKNAGSTYQRLVNMMFKEHLGRTMEVYIDDMLVKSERSIDHVAHLKQSFDILRQYKMKLNPTKCSFGVRAGKFLGYLVTQRGIEASPEQVKAITEIQSPRNIKENQGFLWTDEQEKALQKLKQYMASPPLLTKPVVGESLQLYLAVSKNATSAVLVREEDQQQRPIYYISKSFLDAETSGFDIEFKPKTTIKSQALADFVAEFSPGVEPTTCDEVNNVMISDNKPWLLYVDGSSNVRGCGLGVVFKSSQGGNMDIALRLGAKQLHVRSDSLLVVNQINGDFQAKDSKTMNYLKAVKDRIAQSEYFLIEQIPRDLNMQADALANLGSAFHDPSMENIPILHFTTPTIEAKDEVQMNEEVYNWSIDTNSIGDPQLDSFYDVSQIRRKLIEFSKKCTMENVGITQGAEALPIESYDKSILIPWPFMRWGMDIIGKLPPAPGQKVYLLVLTDYFSNWIEAGAFSQVRDREVISFIQNNIIHRFGVPSEIMCDNGSQFISDKTRTFCEKRGNKLVTSTPRYSQSNGLAESSNKVIINSIRKRLKGAKEELRENALRTMAAQKGLVERHFNKKIKAKIFQVGDYVLRHVFQNTQEPNAGKLSIKWEGPYVISKVIGNGAYQLTTMEGIEIPRSWNAHHLKRYYF